MGVAQIWEALGRWQEALELQPNNAQVWEMRAQVRTFSGILVFLYTLC